MWKSCSTRCACVVLLTCLAARISSVLGLCMHLCMTLSAFSTTSIVRSFRSLALTLHLRVAQQAPAHSHAPISLKERNALIAGLLLSEANALEKKMTCVPQSEAARRAARLYQLHAEKLAQARSLSLIRFHLRMCVEVVDPKVGQRAVAYLFVVITPDGEKRTIVRSAKMMQKVLRRSEEYSSTRLTCESRTHEYECIEDERIPVSKALQLLAASSQDIQLCSLLYDCLMKSGSLPKVRTPEELGLHLSASHRDAMSVLLETSIFRVHSESFLRHEWCILTTSHLQFFRSFSLYAERTIPIRRIVAVRRWKLPILQEEDRGNQWYCVQVVLMDENIKFVVGDESTRDLLMHLLNDMLGLRSEMNLRMRQGPHILAASGVVVLNQQETFAENQPQFCVSHDTSRDAVELAELLLQKALAWHEDGFQTSPTSEELMQFLDQVSLLRVVNVSNFASREHKRCFLLNLYHVLYIHATLVYGNPSSHRQWQLWRQVPRYLVGLDDTHVTLGDLERMLDAQVASNANSGGTNDLTLDCRDFRTSFALQLNTNPSQRIIRVYHVQHLHEELNRSCATYLSWELRIDSERNIVLLPHLCRAWVDQVGSVDDGLSSKDECLREQLQKLVEFVTTTQRAQIHRLVLQQQQVPLQLHYNTFWTDRPWFGVAWRQKWL